MSSAAPTYAGICCAMVWIACCGWGDLEDGDYVARSLGEVALTTCASPGYLARYGAPATLEDLQSHLAVNWVNSSSRQIMPGDSRPRRASGRSPFPVNWCWTTLKSLLLPGWRGWGCCRGCVSFATLYRQRATGGSFAGLSGAASTVVAALSAPASLA